MRLGKRRKDDEPVADPAADAEAVPGDRLTGTWIASEVSPDEPLPAALEDQPLTAAESAGDEPLAAESAEHEPAIDGEAVELVGDVPVPTAAPEPVAIPVMPEPVGSPTPAPAPRMTLPPPIPDESLAGSTASAFAGPPADPLRDEIRVLASERPEIVVGAAFAGGILAAMILRRLGN